MWFVFGNACHGSFPVHAIKLGESFVFAGRSAERKCP
jgi:hypothetical protein